MATLEQIRRKKLFDIASRQSGIKLEADKLREGFTDREMLLRMNEDAEAELKRRRQAAS